MLRYQLLLVSAAFVASSLGAPTVCTEFCDHQTFENPGYDSGVSGSQSHNSYQYESHGRHTSGGANGGASGRYENLGGSMVGSSGGVGAVGGTGYTSGGQSYNSYRYESHGRHTSGGSSGGASGRYENVGGSMIGSSGGVGAAGYTGGSQSHNSYEYGGHTSGGATGGASGRYENVGGGMVGSSGGIGAVGGTGYTSGGESHNSYKYESHGRLTSGGASGGVNGRYENVGGSMVGSTAGTSGAVGGAEYTSGSQSHNSFQYGGRNAHTLGGTRGGVSGRYENLDENVTGTTGTTGSVGNTVSTGSGNPVTGTNFDRPGNWQDEKHYVTDDGKGELSYRAGQTVTDNGFSKFAEERYNYGTHNRHVPLAHSQVLNTAEFQQEYQNLRNLINSFMGHYNFDANSVVNANLLADFKNQAHALSSQMNDVCNHVDFGSMYYQQMQQMQQQFQKNISAMQHQMEQMMLHATKH